MQDPPERPKGYTRTATGDGTFQAWTVSGESCPEGTVPIRRTTEEDVLRASSIRTFGRKPAGRVRRDSTSTGHEVSPKEPFKTSKDYEGEINLSSFYEGYSKLNISWLESARPATHTHKNHLIF